MSCPAHGTRRARSLEAARPPGEPAAVQRQTQSLAQELEPIHAAILAGIVGGGAGGLAQIPLGSLSAVRRAVSLRFASRGDPFRNQFDELVAVGAEQGRATAVRRYGLDVSPTFGPDEGGSLSDLPRGSPIRSDLERSADRARSQVQPRMVRDISQAIYEASEAGLSREEIHDQLRDNTFEQARSVEAQRIAQTEIPAASNRGALAAYDDAGIDSKRWVAMDDHRTRRTHNDADNQVVPLGDDFSVGGFDARFPGDYRLPPKERINCRCWVATG